MGEVEGGRGCLRIGVVVWWCGFGRSMVGVCEELVWVFLSVVEVGEVFV